jgi:hypothetical protein
MTNNVWTLEKPMRHRFFATVLRNRGNIFELHPAKASSRRHCWKSFGFGVSF